MENEKNVVYVVLYENALSPLNAGLFDLTIEVFSSAEKANKRCNDLRKEDIYSRIECIAVQ